MPAVRALTQAISSELAASLATNGIILILAVGATILTEQLFEWLIGNAHVTGDKKQAAFEYGQAYAHAVFEKTPFRYSGTSNKEMLELFTSVAEAAMLDVAADMRGPEVGLSFPDLATPVYTVGAGIQSSYWNGAR